MQNIFLAISASTWILIFAVTDHYLPWVSWHSEVIASLSIFFAFVSIIFSEKKIIEIPRECSFLLLFLVVALIQSFFGKLIYKTDLIILTLYLVITMLAVVVAYMHTVDAKDKGRPTELISIVFLFSALILSVQSVIRALDLSFMSEWVVGIGARRRPGGNLAQPNHMATMLNFGVVSLFYLRFRLRVYGWIFWSALVVIVVGLVISESRTGLLSFNALIFIVCFYGFPLRKRERVACLVFAFGVNVLFFLWPNLWGLMQLMGDVVPSSVNLTSSGRIDLWVQAISAIGKKPLFGWGYHQFSLAHMNVIPDYDKVLIATYSHNIFIDLACWFGVPFASLFAYIFLRWIRSALKGVLTFEAKFAFLFLLPFFIHALLEFPHAYLYFLIPVGLAVGSIVGSSSNAVLFSINKKYFSIFLVPIVLVGLLSIFEYFVVEEDFRLARFASVRVGSDPKGYQRRELILLSSLSELVDVVRMDPKPNTLINLDIARRVSLTYPWRAVMVKYAMEARMNGELAEYDRQMVLLIKYFGDGAALEVKQKLLEKSKEFIF